MPAALAVSLAGLWFHDAREFPGTHGLTGDLLLMAGIGAALLAATWKFRWATWALIGFGVLMLVGGLMSVLPLPFLPYKPEQSGYHYFSHAVYALAQVPLLALAAARLRASANVRRPTSRS